MAARSLRLVCALLVIGFTLPGCASTGCGWWGRNSDGSSNIGNKSVNPTQPGPLAGTYARPGNGMTTPMPQSPSGQTSNQTTPIVTSSPAQSMPSSNLQQNNNLNFPAPLSPLNNTMMPTNYRTEGTVGPTSLNGLPSVELNPAPDVKVTMPTVPTPNVLPPAMNFNMPGTPVSGPGQPVPSPKVNQPLPMMFVPPAAPNPVQMNSVPAPTISPPSVAPINLQVPGATSGGVLPPPLPLAPTPPSLDGK